MDLDAFRVTEFEYISGGLGNWTPLSLGADLKLWLDASDASTITITGSGVSQWRDKSGNANHGNQATDANRPAYTSGQKVTAAADSNQALDFTGMQENYDFAVAGKPWNDAQSASWRTLIWTQASRHPLLAQDSSTAIGTYNAGFFQAGTLTWGNVAGIAYGRVDTVAIFADDTLLARDGAALTSTNSGDMTPKNLVKLLNNDNAQAWGEVYEFVLLNVNASEDNRRKLELYLSQKWGIPLDPSFPGVGASNPTGWTSRWDAGGTFTGLLDAGFPSGKGARLVSAASTDKFFSFDAAPSIKNVSIVGQVRVSGTGAGAVAIARGAGASTTETGYRFGFNGDGANVTLSSYKTGTFASHATAAFAYAASTFYWFRFDVADSGSNALLRAKIWTGALSDEPSAWTITFTDSSSPITAAGWSGIYNGGTLNYDFGHFQVRSIFGSTLDTLRYAISTDYLLSSVAAIPNVVGVQLTPATISLGENMGQRATMTVGFKDHRHADWGELFPKGSYWGKFRGRQLFRRGQPLRVKRGLLDQLFANFETRYYVTESFEGPTPDGSFTIVGKDPLKLADDDRAQAPALSNGFLNAAILADSPGVVLSPTGVGSQYPSTGYAAIGGKETVEFQKYTSGGIDGNTKLLLHFDGADASTTFTDSSGTGKTATVTGNAQIDTEFSVFGGGAGLFDGNGDYLTYADHADFTPAGDFTIDCRIRIAALANTMRICTHYTDSNNYWTFRVRSTNQLEFEVFSGGASIINLISPTGAFLLNKFYHVAIVRNGNNYFLFIDGIIVATLTTATAIPNFTAGFRIAADNVPTASLYWNGSIEEFSLHHAARWTAQFIPPPVAYQSAALTDTFAIRRAQFGSTAVEHKAEDRFQLCLQYTAQNPADIINDLLVNYADIASSYISLSTWQTECSTFLQRNYTRLIAEPTGVNKLISQLIEQAGLALWHDDKSNTLKLLVIRAVDTTVFNYTEDNVIAGSIRTQEQPAKRITQVWTYYGVRNPLEPLEQPDNYRSTLATVDLEAETLHGSPVIRKIFGTWIPSLARTTAQRVNDLQISRYATAPRRISFDVMRYSGINEPLPGGGYRLKWTANQDAAGNSISAPIQLTRVEATADRFKVEAEEMLAKAIVVDDLKNRVIVYDGNILNTTVRTAHDSIYPAPTAADIFSGVNLKVTVAAGVIVGSSSAGTSAMVVGTFPTNTLTGNTSAGSAVVTSLSVSPLLMKVGTHVTGAGIPAGAKIASVDSATQFTLNMNASATATGVTLTVHFYVLLDIIGRVQGRGGNGGKGETFGPSVPGQPGVAGGTALFTRHIVDLDGGEVWGGGGGGGGGTAAAGGSGGGGGGAGTNVGTGGAGGISAHPGADGTATAGGAGGAPPNTGNDGGAGGGPGLAGTGGEGPSAGAGGGAGVAFDGVSYITIIGSGQDIRGGQIN